MAQEHALTHEGTGGMPALLPWHRESAARLRAALDEQRFPHALLIRGLPGVGKRLLLEWIAAFLLCEQRQSGPCGQCRGCTLYRAGSHPDLCRVGLTEGSQQVRIDAIRELIRFTRLHSQYGADRVAIVDPADRMNRNAANTLLKTLEEPPAGVRLLLVADQAAMLPPTVRSRCQQVSVPIPPSSEAVAWLAHHMEDAQMERMLALAGHAPLRALELADADNRAVVDTLLASLAGIADGSVPPVQGAAAWSRDRLPMLLRLLTVFVQMVIRRESTGSATAAVPELASVPRHLDLGRLHGYLDYLYDTHRLRDRALQPQLFAEDLLIRWRQACVPNPGSRRKHAHG